MDSAIPFRLKADFIPRLKSIFLNAVIHRMPDGRHLDNIVYKYIRIYLYSADPIVKRKAKNSSKSSKTNSPTPLPPSGRSADYNVWEREGDLTSRPSLIRIG